MPGQHVFRPLAPRVWLLEFLAGALSAAGIGVAASFYSDSTTPRALTISLLVASSVLLAYAALWLWQVQARMSAEANGIPLTRLQSSLEAVSWSVLSGVVTLVVVALTAATFALGFRSDPDYSSFYDGQDPNVAKCVDSAVRPVAKAGSTVLIDANGRRIGTTQLRESPRCGTVWAKVFIDASQRPRLKGQTMEILMVRPGDGRHARYLLPLSGGVEGFGNMMSNSDACVEARIGLLDSTNRVARYATTPCVSAQEK